MTSRSRSLGNAGEEGIVLRAIKAGLKAFRQPGSGIYRDYPADVVVEAEDIRVLVESKVRQIYVSPRGKTTWTIDFNWLRQVMRQAKEHDGFDHGALFVRPKSSTEHFVLLNEEDYLRLLSRP